MKKFSQSRLAQRAVAIGSLVVAAGSAMADTSTIDTSAAVTQISGTTTNVLAIGAAVFGVAVSVKLYKWLRSAL